MPHKTLIIEWLVLILRAIQSGLFLFLLGNLAWEIHNSLPIDAILLLLIKSIGWLLLTLISELLILLFVCWILRD